MIFLGIFWLLNNLGIEYKENVRYRDTTHIMGKALKTAPKPAYEFYFKHEDLSELLKDKYKIPRILYSMSKRQFEIFIASIIDGDGSFKKDINGKI